MKKNLIAWPIAALLSLSGCGYMPLYQPAPADKTMTVSVLGNNYVRMCLDGKRYRVPDQGREPNRSVVLPVGQRVTLTTSLFRQGGFVNTSCEPSLSLVPTEGKPLVIRGYFDIKVCYIEAVREDAASPTGVVPDPTVGPPMACTNT